MASRRDRILEQLCRQLRLIVSGDPVGKPGTTYANDFAATSVQRWDLDQNDRSALPCAIVVAEEETYEDQPVDQLWCKLAVVIEVYGAPLRHDTLYPSVDGYRNSLLRDVLLALLSNRELIEDVTNVQLCTKLEPTAVAPFEDEEAHAFLGFALEVLVSYQTSNIDPDVYV
jgi:hypothetical protein